MKTRFALRWVALFEFAKGLVVVLATTSLLTLVHLNPAAHYPGVVLAAGSGVRPGPRGTGSS